MTLTYADLSALSIDTAALPPMMGTRGNPRSNDRTRTDSAKRDSMARRQARTVKRESLELVTA